MNFETTLARIAQNLNPSSLKILQAYVPNKQGYFQTAAMCFYLLGWSRPEFDRQRRETEVRKFLEMCGQPELFMLLDQQQPQQRVATVDNLQGPTRVRLAQELTSDWKRVAMYLDFKVWEIEGLHSSSEFVAELSMRMQSVVGLIQVLHELKLNLAAGVLDPAHSSVAPTVQSVPVRVHNSWEHPNLYRYINRLPPNFYKDLFSEDSYDVSRKAAFRAMMQLEDTREKVVATSEAYRNLKRAQNNTDFLEQLYQMIQPKSLPVRKPGHHLDVPDLKRLYDFFTFVDQKLAATMQEDIKLLKAEIVRQREAEERKKREAEDMNRKYAELNEKANLSDDDF